MDTKLLPQMLLIAGTGRNSGKTTLACAVIKKFSSIRSIIAVKISPHYHAAWKSGEMLLKEPNCFLAEETNFSGTKDSALMLNAGAHKSFFAMASDNNLEKIISAMLANAPKNALWVCESGGLRHWITPGLFLIMNNPNYKDLKPKIDVLRPLADQWITFDGKNIDFDINTLEIANNTWRIKKNDHVNV